MEFATSAIWDQPGWTTMAMKQIAKEILIMIQLPVFVLTCRQGCIGLK
jgi:hypothetical protein